MRKQNIINKNSKIKKENIIKENQINLNKKK